MSPLRVWSQQLKLGFCLAYDNSGLATKEIVQASKNVTAFISQLNTIIGKNNTNDFTNFKDFSASTAIPYEVNKRIGQNFVFYYVCITIYYSIL